MNGRRSLSLYHSLAILAATALFVIIVDGALPQLQMRLLSGHVLNNSFGKVALMGSLAAGALLHPRIALGRFPVFAWSLFVAYLVLDVGYLQFECSMPMGNLLQAYNSYYSLIVIIPAALIFRGTVPEKLIIRLTLWLFYICAAIGIAQYLLERPLMPTESADGSFGIQAWDFFDKVRAFSLFSCSLKFGIFCALCGALGIALSRERRVLGISCTLLSAYACYTTLTRNCYLVYGCACAYSALMTYGKKPSRGFWQPLLYLAVGISTVVFGMRSFNWEDSADLDSTSSLVERFVEWVYYGGLVSNASIDHQMLGLGMAQSDKTIQTMPAPVDNMPLGLVLHIGFVGLVFCAVLAGAMWHYVRQEALVRQQPFVTAAASLWATLACACMFNTIVGPYEAVLALVILCGHKKGEVNRAELDTGVEVQAASSEG